jgi:hypothetical protein
LRSLRHTTLRLEMGLEWRLNTGFMIDFLCSKCLVPVSITNGVGFEKHIYKM